MSDYERFAGDDPETSTGKSERKRQREKQRRSDLANAFDELATLLSQIEPGQGGASTASGTKKRRRKSGDAAEVDTSGEHGSGLTRLDVIGRTIEALRKLHKENLELKQSLAQGRPARGGSDDKVRPNLSDRSTTRASCRLTFTSNFGVALLILV